MPKLADGTYASSRVGALRRIKEYALIAESGNAAALQALIGEYTQDANVHPDGVIYELVVILLGIYRGMGRSPIPSLDKAIAAARGDVYSHDPAAVSKLILPH